jgi:hypothetical protein
MGIDPRSLIFRVLGFWAPTVTDSASMMFAWAGICQQRFPHLSKVPCLDLYESHANWVRNVVPKDRLLEFEPSMGWEPLCQFLEKDIPNTEYPRSNDRNVIKLFKIIAMGIGSFGWALMFLVLVTILNSKWAIPRWVEQKICTVQYVQFVEGSI